MNELFVCTHKDGTKTLTQMGQLFSALENAEKELKSLSFDDETDDVFAFNCAVECAIREYKKALDALKVHCASVELSAQMAGVM